MNSAAEKIERRIFFLCPDVNDVLGGVRKIYQHVDILNRHGYKAFILHSQRGFRCTWFQNDTSIAYPLLPSGTNNNYVYPGNLPLITNTEKLPAINPQDIVVVPEIWAFEFSKVLSKEQLFVIFTQNAYYTFNGQQLPQTPFSSDKELLPNIYKASTLLGIIVVSQDSLECMQFTFPKVPVYRIHLSVDSKRFGFSPTKRKQIAYMPRKKAHDIQQLIGILLARGELKGWSFVPIDNKTEEEVAEIMKKSWMFLSTGGFEGFGLPPMEAMLCGCLVVGYHGEGGKEYIHPPYAVHIHNEDMIGFAKAIELIAADIDLHPQDLLDKAKQNSAILQNKYSQEQEEKDVLTVWNTVLQLLV